MFNPFNRNKILSQEFDSENGKLALLEFKGEIKNDIINKFKENYNITGSHVKNGGKISPKVMLSLVGASGGSLALTAKTSSQLFMATVNPATLMVSSKGGVFSAVVGSGSKITAQAPFIAAGGPVVIAAASVLAVATISTIYVLNQFKKLEQRFDKIESAITRVIQRAEAIYIGEIFSALNRIEDIEDQFEINKNFTSEMILRLCLVESSMNPIFERFKFLFQSQPIDKEVNIEDLKFKQNDAYFAIIASILDLRIDTLRLRLAIQDDPGNVKNLTQRVNKKIKYYSGLWEDISTNPKLIKDVAKEIKESIEEMSWWNKNIPEYLWGQRSERKNLEKKAVELTNHSKLEKKTLKDDLGNAQEFGKDLKKSLNNETNTLTLVYWRDELGEHSYYTQDLNLIQHKKTG